MAFSRSFFNTFEIDWVQFFTIFCYSRRLEWRYWTLFEWIIMWSELILKWNALWRQHDQFEPLNWRDLNNLRFNTFSFDESPCIALTSRTNWNAETHLWKHSGSTLIFILIHLINVMKKKNFKQNNQWVIQRTPASFINQFRSNKLKLLKGCFDVIN